MIKASYFLDLRRPDRNQKFPLYIQYYKDRKYKMHQTGFSLHADEWDSNMNEFSRRFKGYLKANIRLREELNNIQLKLLDFEEKLPGIELKEAYDLLYNKEENLDPFVYEFTKRIEKELNSAGKQGTAKTYRTFRQSLRKHKPEDFRMSRVNYQFLKDYETHLYKRGVKPNGISTYMRSLRAVINRAIKEDLFPQDKYPFRKYKIPKAPTKKLALSMEQIRSVLNANLEHKPHLIDTHNYLKFMLHMRGMNFHDMAKLKKQNVQGDRIIYTRSKTGHVFDIEMSEEAKALVELYSKHTKHRVFPLIDEIPDNDKKFDIKITSQRRRINKHLKEIAEVIELPVNLTTYVIRHTWASLAKFQGVSSHIISESLGHANLSTTETYLASFHHSKLDETNSELLKEIGG